MGFTSREIATAIIALVLILLSLLLSKERAKFLQCLFDLAKTFRPWKVWATVLAYLAFVTAVVMAAYSLGVWSIDLLKDTVIIGLFVGLPILFKSFDFKGGLEVIKHVAKEVLGVAALLLVYVNLRTFPLWVEVLLQVAILFSLAISFIAKQDPKTAPVGRFFQNLVGLIVIGMIVYVTCQVINHFSDFDWGHDVATFALSVWLPVSLIPFVYVFGLIATCETALVRGGFHNGRERLPLSIRLGFLLGVRGRLLYATSFTGHWLPELAAQSSFREALQMMRRYRRSVRCVSQRNRARRRRLKKNAGVVGVDENNYWLDRRQFHETKEALKRIFYTQMGLYRFKGGKYWTNPDVVFPAEGFVDLPEDHGIRFEVREDGQAWAAWRRTLGGFYLGVGGTSDLNAHWRYAGAEAPLRYPGSGIPGWADVSERSEASSEWSFHDSPFDLSSINCFVDLRARG